MNPQSPLIPQGPDPQADSWVIRSGSLSLRNTLVMGVLNLTPDSFSDGGLFLKKEDAVSWAREMISEGADILDLGAESTRPGAAPVDAREELARLLPVLRAIKKEFTIPVSVDTTKAEVAQACLVEGADIINDVSGLKDSGKAMVRAVRKAVAGLILMHRRGNPETMQSLAEYQDVVSETVAELRESFEFARQEGVQTSQIAVDPGLGFAKTAEQNLELLAGIGAFHAFGRPIVLGPSRKSFIGKVTGREASQREFGTAAVAAHAVMNHVQILRVHSVGPIKDVIKMIKAIQGACHVRS